MYVGKYPFLCWNYLSFCWPQIYFVFVSFIQQWYFDSRHLNTYTIKIKHTGRMIPHFEKTLFFLNFFFKTLANVLQKLKSISLFLFLRPAPNSYFKTQHWVIRYRRPTTVLSHRRAPVLCSSWMCIFVGLEQSYSPKFPGLIDWLLKFV